MKICWPVLLLLVAGCRKEESGGGGGVSSPTSTGSGNVRSVEVVTEGGHRRIRIVAEVRNTGSSALEAGPPSLQLWAGEKPVPQFIAPGLAPTIVAPGATVEVETFWWLNAAGTALEFEVQGSRSRVSLP